MTTIKDVASACGVSTATASRALSGLGYVNKAKRELIRKKAEELGYIVDSHAKSLKSGKSNMIGVIVSDINNYFYNLILEKLIDEFKKLGYNVLLAYSFENSSFERANIKSFLSLNVDALIFTPVSNANADLVQLMQKREVKLLQLFRQAYPTVDAICVDDEHGAYLATKHLLDRGFRDILLLSVKLDFTPNRSNGYRKAFLERGLPVNENLIRLYPLGHSIEPEIQTLIEHTKPDAIIAGTNNFGLDALIALKQLNYHSEVVVFDDLEYFDLLDITTVAQPIDVIFKNVIAATMAQIDQTEQTLTGHLMSIPPHLNIRGKK